MKSTSQGRAKSVSFRARGNSSSVKTDRANSGSARLHVVNSLIQRVARATGTVVRVIPSNDFKSAEIEIIGTSNLDIAVSRIRNVLALIQGASSIDLVSKRIRTDLAAITSVGSSDLDPSRGRTIPLAIEANGVITITGSVTSEATVSLNIVGLDSVTITTARLRSALAYIEATANASWSVSRKRTDQVSISGVSSTHWTASVLTTEFATFLASSTGSVNVDPSAIKTLLLSISGSSSIDWSPSALMTVSMAINNNDSVDLLIKRLRSVIANAIGSGSADFIPSIGRNGNVLIEASESVGLIPSASRSHLVDISSASGSDITESAVKTVVFGVAGYPATIWSVGALKEVAALITGTAATSISAESAKTVVMSVLGAGSVTWSTSALRAVTAAIFGASSTNWSSSSIKTLAAAITGAASTSISATVSTSGFTEITDPDAGKYTINSMVNTRNWSGSSVITAWDTEDHRDTDLFNAEDASGEVRVLEDGLYLVMASMVMDRLGGSNRSCARAYVAVNDVYNPIGCSSFIRRSSGHDSDETTLAGILNLSADDDVEIRSQKLQSAGSDGYWTGPDNSYTSMNSSFSLVRLNKNNPFISLTNTGTANDQQLTADDTDTDMNWNSQTDIDTDYFGHSTSVNPDEITLKQAGKYIVCYTNYWQRLTDNATRTGVYERLKLDGSDVHGSWTNNYLRGSQSSEGITFSHNNNITLIETDSADQILKLTAAREAGAITNERKSTDSSIQVYLLHGNEETFSIGSSTTENMGSTTAAVPTFDSSDWIDSNYSLSSSEIMVTGAKDMLFGGAITTNESGSSRVGARLTMRVNGSESLLFSGAAYGRNTAGMEKMSPVVAGILSPTNGQTIGLYMKSTAASSTTSARAASTGRFWGIDLNTL